MAEHFSPNLFLFQSYVTQVLKQSKKIIKTGPFENIDPQSLVQSNKTQQIDIYHQYFLSAMSHQKCRELACNRYEQLLRQNLVDRENLPVGMISSILSACSSGGGSTTGSSSVGSATISINPQNQAAFVGELVKSIILNTAQPPGELVVGLNFLLQGTRKKLSPSYLAMMEEIYSNFLTKNRQPPLTRFISLYISNLIDEIQANYHNPSYVYCSRKMNYQKNKIQMPIYDEQKGWGKYGRCYMCSKQAYHYIKEQYMPVCSIQCKNRARQLMEECKSNQSFNLMGWLMENLHFGDQIIFSMLARQIAHYVGLNQLSFSVVQTILKASIHHIGHPILHKLILQIFVKLSSKIQEIIHPDEITRQNMQKIEQINKVYYLQILKILEESSIQKQSLQYVQAVVNILQNQETFKQIFVRYDSNFFEVSILSRFLNIISQYAKIFPTGVDGLEEILMMLMDRCVIKGKEENFIGWNEVAFAKKKQLKKVIRLFNKKPINGIKFLKKMFEDEQQIKNEREFNLQESQISFSDQNSKCQVELTQGKQEEEKEKDEKDEKPQKKKQEKEEKEKQKEENSEKLQMSQINTKNTNEGESMSQEVEKIKEVSLPKLEKPMSSQLKVEEPASLSKITNRQIAIFIKQNLQSGTTFSLQPKLIQPLSLQKAKVGQYFGSQNPQCQNICRQFISLIDVKGMQIDDALRMILTLFTLPKETQQVGRIIQNITTHLLSSYPNFSTQTSLYQYIYVLMMVQTNQNPNVQERDKLKVDDYLSMCKYVEGGVDRDFAVRNFNRIVECPLDIKMKFSDDQIFVRKYLAGLEREGERNELFNSKADREQNAFEKSILLHIWEYLLIGLISLTNTQGMFPAIVLYGKYGLVEEQKAFFQVLRKIAESNRSLQDQCNNQLLRVAIDHGNCLHTLSLWETIISILYHLESVSQLHSSTLDKLFTNSKLLNVDRLKEFVQALLVFSTSQFRKDGGYMRELFVLRHVTQVVQYNVSRWGDIGGQVWGMLGDYFKDICVHPRRQIAMAAIDSYKQLSLKLFKFPFNPPVPHSPILSTYLYVFMRSPLQLKDLIINILLTLISRDLNSGWDSIYGVLEIADSQDRQVIGRIVGRMIKEIGVGRLDEIGRLHGICLREVKLRGQGGKGAEEMLRYVWEISQFIDSRETWLQTMRSIRDVYKMTCNFQLLTLFYRIANKCLQWHPSQRNRRESIDQIQFAQSQHQSRSQSQERQQKLSEDVKEEKQISINRQIYGQVVDLMIFMMDFGAGSVKGQGKALQIVAYALSAFQQIHPWFVIKYFGGSYGFLSIFQMFLNSTHKLQFALWLRTYIIERINPLLLGEDTYEKQKQQMYQWAISTFLDLLPIELGNLKQMDADFKKQLKDLIKESNMDPKAAEQPKDQNKSELIEFHLSSKEYYEKCIVHLIFLDIVDDIYVKGLKPFIPLNSSLMIKFEDAIIESYECSLHINKLVLLRTFLHSNNFLASPSSQILLLPGLHKQENRTISIVIKQMQAEERWPYFIGVIKRYVERVKLKTEIAKEVEKQIKKGIQNKEKEQKQKLGKQTQKSRKNSKSGAIVIVQLSANKADKRWQLFHSDLSLWLIQSKPITIHSLQTLSTHLSNESSFLHSKQQSAKHKQLFAIGLDCLALPEMDLQIVRAASSMMQQVYTKIL